MAIGENSNIDSSDKDKMHDIKGRIGDLTYRLEDIRREQVFQRVSLHRSFIVGIQLLICIS